MAISWKAAVLCVLALACVVLAGDEPGVPTPKRHHRAPWRWSSDDDEEGDYTGFSFRGYAPRGPDSDFDSGSDSRGGFDDGDRDGARDGGLSPQRGLAIDFEKANHVRNIHGILAAVLFVGVFPLGAILVRAAKRHVWLHAGVQIVALGGYVAAAALGIWLALYIRIPRGDGTVNLFQEPSINFHPIIGLIVLLLLLLQPLWGVLHHQRFKTLRRRQVWSDLHLWTGRMALPLGMVNGALGLWRSGASSAVLISYSVVAALVWAVWMWFAVRHEVRGRWGGEEKAGSRGPSAARSPVVGSPSSSSPRRGSRRASGRVSTLSSDRPRSRHGS